VNIAQLVKSYFITLAVFLIIDVFWIGLFAKKLYQEQIGFLLKEKFNMPVALLFYLLFVVGLLFFVINPALAKSSWQFALFAGAFFGLITYATYDLTNLATIKDWPVFITVVDMIWGTAVGAVTSLLSYLLIRRL
jgi:uncharacterized membrane protein